MASEAAAGPLLDGFKLADLHVDKASAERLKVHAHFAVRFGGAPQLLRVPFGAVTRFFDPSTNFGVQMEPLDTRADTSVPAIIPPKRASSAGAPAPAAATAAPDATIVSLDAFRRK
jgi:hypothetical protein